MATNAMVSRSPNFSLSCHANWISQFLYMVFLNFQLLNISSIYINDIFPQISILNVLVGDDYFQCMYMKTQNTYSAGFIKGRCELFNCNVPASVYSAATVEKDLNRRVCQWRDQLSNNKDRKHALTYYWCICRLRFFIAFFLGNFIG